MNQKLKVALLVGVLTTFFDYLFHLSFTEPIEVPAYFGVKFAIAFLVAYIYLAKVGPAKAALYFTVLFSILYYGVGVYVLNVPGLSVYSSTGYICVFGTCSIVEVGVVEFFVHMIVFFIAAKVALSQGRRYTPL